VFYEAPHRIVDTLEDVVEVIGPQRQIVVAREVTKLYEEFLRGTAQKVLENFKARDEVRGEITLLIGKAEDFEQNASTTRLSLKQRLQQIIDEERLDEKAALKKVAKELGISKSEAYREWQRSK
jgi:16S rRNA (cytidine1402-2'-O)-methyltransferase